MKLGNKQLVEKLTRSAIYRDYVRAFSAATGMPLALRAVEHWQPALRGAPNENPFCELMARSNRVCAACLEVQRKLTEKTGDRSRTVTCFAGLSDSAVPIRVGDQLIGFLQTGQVLLKQPDKFRFDQVAKQLVNWGVEVDLSKAREAYFHTKVLTKKQYRAMLRLLEIFGRHLSILSNQLAVENSTAEPLAVTRAKQFIARNQDNADLLGHGRESSEHESHFIFANSSNARPASPSPITSPGYESRKPRRSCLTAIVASARSLTMWDSSRSLISIAFSGSSSAPRPAAIAGQLPSSDSPNQEGR